MIITKAPALYQCRDGSRVWIKAIYEGSEPLFQSSDYPAIGIRAKLDEHGNVKLIDSQVYHAYALDGRCNVNITNNPGDIVGFDGYYKTAEEWRNRFVHIAKKCAVVLGLNNQERQWVREAGFECPDEETPNREGKPA